MTIPRSATAPALVAALVLAAGCGGPSAPPAPPGLAWDVPATPSVAYLRGDTAVVEVDAGGRILEIDVISRALLDLTFESEDDGVRVTADVREFEARMSNPMMPSPSVDQESIRGSLVFRMDRRGEVTVLEEPTLDGMAGQMFASEDLASSLFPRLPGRAVEPGSTWTDTVRVDAEQPRGSIQATSVATWTVVGDTVVGGRTLLRVDVASEEERVMEGDQGGVEVVQDLEGSGSGWFLWDRSRGLVVESVQTARLTGTMGMSALPAPLPVEVRSRHVVRLQDPPGGGGAPPGPLPRP